MPTTVNIPPMTANGTFSAWLPNSRTIRPSHRPAKTPPNRLLAPAPTLTPVRDSDPPVPIDWKKLPARLPNPSPTKSRDWLDLLPSGFGTAVLMPAPCASATSATDIDPSASCGIRLKFGSMNDGRLLGMVAMLPTSAVWILSRFTMNVTASITMIAANFSSGRMRFRRTIRRMVTTDTATVVLSHCDMFCSQLMVFWNSSAPTGL